jgi:hypothetical protein
MPLECVLHVREAPQAIISDLGRGGTRTYQFSNWLEHRKTGAQLHGQELRLIEASLSQADGMERHRDDAACRQTLNHQPFRKQLR